MYHRDTQHFPQVDSEVCFQRFFPALLLPCPLPCLLPLPNSLPSSLPSSCRWQYIHRYHQLRCVFEFSMAFYLPYVIRSLRQFRLFRPRMPHGKSIRQRVRVSSRKPEMVQNPFRRRGSSPDSANCIFCKRKNKTLPDYPGFSAVHRDAQFVNQKIPQPNEAWNSDRMGGHGGSKGDLMSSGAFQDFAVANYNGKDRRQAGSA